jgi:UDP-glucose 4-epimerase
VRHPIKRQHIESAIGDARHTSADVTKAQRILGYQPQVTLEDGLRQEWDWIKALYK